MLKYKIFHFKWEKSIIQNINSIIKLLQIQQIENIRKELNMSSIIFPVFNWDGKKKLFSSFLEIW